MYIYICERSGTGARVEKSRGGGATEQEGRGGAKEGSGTQFPCFTGTKVQILTRLGAVENCRGCPRGNARDE